MHKILITGGLGYIGSHTVISLLESNYDVHIIDNMETSEIETLDTIKEITNKTPTFTQGDIRNKETLNKLFKENKFDYVIHFAAYKNVKESMEKPDKYYENNVVGTYNLVTTMLENDINNIVFSSSCSVHGQPKTLPVKENDELKPLSPYARTKLAVEYMLEDFKSIGLNSVKLRYFNAAGAHPTGKIGENPKILLNVIPRIIGNAFGKYELKIFGNNFNTKDGYQERDYIHVVDLADAHVKALSYLEKHKGSYTFGLSTGVGTSVKQIIDEIQKVSGKEIKYEIVDPIKGDPIQVYGNSELAEKELGWKPMYDYHQIIEHAWNWYKDKEKSF